MEMADVIVINKADGDNIRKAKLAKVNSTGHYIFSGQNRLDTQPLPAALLDQRASSSLANNRSFWNLPKADYFYKKTLSKMSIG
jgi:hypothetical protein